MFTAKRKGFLAFFAALILASLIGLGLIFIPDNTRALAANAEDGTTTETDATTPDSSHVAQVGETGYDTLQEAINAAGIDATVKLLSDVNENVTVAEDKDITLDLNGKTIKGVEGSIEYIITNKGDLSLISTASNPGNILGAKGIFNGKNSSDDNLPTELNCTLNLSNVIVEGDGSVGSLALINSFGIIESITDCVITNSNGTTALSNSGYIKEIANTTITATSSSLFAGVAISLNGDEYIENSGTIEFVEGGAISGKINAGSYSAKSAYISLSENVAFDGSISVIGEKAVVNNYVSTVEGLVEALKTDGVNKITLGNDVANDGSSFVIDKSLTLDLNGHTINSTSDDSGKNITLMVIGSDKEDAGRIAVNILSSVEGGKILRDSAKDSTAGESKAFVAYGATDILIEGITVENVDANAYGAMFGNPGITAQTIGTVNNSTIIGAYPAVYVAGTQNAERPTKLIVNNSKINGETMGIMGNGLPQYYETYIELNDTVVLADTKNADTDDYDNMGLGIYHPQRGTLIVNGGSVTGVAVGIEIRSGSLTVEGNAVITSTCTSSNMSPNGNGSTTAGAAIAVSQHTTNNDITVTLESGEFNGVYALLERDMQDTNTDNVKIEVSGGKYNGQVGAENVSSFISGGSFSKELDAALINDDSLIYSADGETYTVGKYEEVAAMDDVVIVFNKKAYTSEEEAVKAGVVAKIGKTGYATLQEAVDSITSAEQTEIVLLDDVELAASVRIPSNKNIVLNLNEHNIKYAGTVIKFNWNVANNTLTIKGNGIIENTAESGNIIDASSVNIAPVIEIMGGTFRLGSSNSLIILPDTLYGIKINIYNGTFENGVLNGPAGQLGDPSCGLYIYGGTFGKDVKVNSVGGGAIYGGTFGQSAVANAVADGYVFYPSSEDSYAVVAEEDFAINEYCRVQVGENTYYTSLEEAIENVRSGGVITVLQDITMSHAVACGVQNVTLDLNGKTVTIPESFDDKFVVTADKTRAGVAIRVQNSGSLTLKDSSDEQTGKFDATKAANSVNVLSAANATITMVSGTIVVDTNAEACLFAFEGGTIIIEGGTLINECTENYVYGGGAPLVVNINNSTTGKIVVNGGTFTGRNPALGDDSDGGTFLDADAKIAKTADGNFVAYVNDADKPADATDIYYVEDGVVIFEVAALDGFYKAIEDGATYIRLGNDFNNLINAIVIKNEELTIDLNGHSINGSIAGVATGENGNGKELLFLIDSNINIINTADTEGVIAVNDGNTTSKTIYYDAIYAERTNLTIENVTIQSLNNDGEGIAFLGKYTNDEISSNYENTSTFYTLNIIDSKILGYAQAIIGNGAFHGTIINIENSEITATDGWAIYHPQYGILNVKGTNTTITGGTAIEMRAGILNVEAGTITATAAFEIGKKEDAASGTSMMGVAVAVSQHTTNLDTQVNISGGTLNATDANGKAVYEEDIMDGQSENIALNLAGGTFNAPVESKNEINYISGGSYLVKPADNAFATSYAGELYNGYYIVVKEDASAGESGVTITERLNAQTDVRTYMAAFGLRLSEMQTLAETDSGAAAIIGAYNGILGASAPQALAEAKAAALDAVDKFIDALNAAKEQAITALTEYSVGTDFSIVVVPTYAISAINQATSAAEIELYVASAKAEMDDIRAQRAAATEEAEQLAGIVEALEIVKGEEGWNSSLIDGISGDVDAIMKLIGTAADTSSNETLFGLIQNTSKAISDAIAEFRKVAEEKLENIISKVDALPDYSGEFTELNNAIAQVQTAANAANDSLATMSPTVDSINATVTAMQKVQDELKKTFEEFGDTFDYWTDDMTGRFDALDKAIAALPDNTAAIEELNKLLTEAQKGIDAANESIGKLDTAVGDQLDDIEAKVDVIDGVTDSVLAAQKALETAVAGYKTAADEALAEIKTSLEGVAEDVTELAADVAADKAALSAEIAKLQATADKLEEAVAALDGDSQADLTSISEKLAALQSAVDGVKADVNKVSQSVDTVSDENKNSASSFAGIYTFLSVLVVLVIAVMIIAAIKKRKN